MVFNFYAYGALLSWPFGWVIRAGGVLLLAPFTTDYKDCPNLTFHTLQNAVATNVL